MRLLEVIQRGASYLEARGVESPRRQVEWILAHVLGVPRLQLYLQFERDLSAAETDAVRAAVTRRGQRVPLQHVLGTTVFCGLELEVSADALIPRPETELLAEQAWTWLASAGRTRVLDWGTGTGCLAIAIAHRVPGAEVVAVDVSPAALGLARRNAARHGSGSEAVGGVRWVESDGCTALDPGETFDLVVSNPPYIPTAECDSLEPEVRDHDPRLALDGGVDGLGFYRRLARELSARLRPGGRVMLEYGEGQSAAVSDEFARAGWVECMIVRDYSGRERFLVAQRSP
ncbi:MAG: peptide chain release factor N(5)-glutamine methyltransferase [Verrucomicrobiales bacterium]|nr:peptide chain release factor N(5)-glutamine methyltransferase [Verrucomicrobiales bacterium]